MATTRTSFQRIAARLSLASVVVCLHGLVSAQDITSSTRGPVSDEVLGQRYPPASLKGPAQDVAYGFTEETPVKVGGGYGGGIESTYRFLNALRGPRGEVVHYVRVGTCCSFKTKNSPFGEESLEVYEISYEGGPTKRLYFNWFDKGDLLVPSGLAARK